MSIHVIKPGMFTTIQDKGRKGYQKYGVLTSGGMDTLSLRIANILTGNEENEAVLEITLMGPGPVLTCQKDELIAVTGADVEIDIDGEPAPLWKPPLFDQEARSPLVLARGGAALTLLWQVDSMWSRSWRAKAPM